tara:strand:- start:578 stop:967 length:390 start_codon:yes stop_codon:yes gene_type:complete
MSQIEQQNAIQAINELKKYFVSEDDKPVHHVTIKADDFWEILKRHKVIAMDNDGNHISIEQKRVLKVLERIEELVSKDEDMAELFSHHLEPMLDDIQMDDGFGTESQQDPRGDGRDGHWSMERVQGIDG